MDKLSYNIEIVETRDNPLTNRKEIYFEIKHPNSGTPNRYEIKQKLAALHAVDEDLVYVKHIRTIFGRRLVKGRANIYYDKESAKLFEPDYIIIRNMPPEKREEARKALREAKRKRSKKKK